MRRPEGRRQLEHPLPRGGGTCFIALRQRDARHEVVRVGARGMSRRAALRDALRVRELPAREQRLGERQEHQARRIGRERVAHRADVVSGHRAPHA